MFKSNNFSITPLECLDSHTCILCILVKMYSKCIGCLKCHFEFQTSLSSEIGWKTINVWLVSLINHEQFVRVSLLRYPLTNYYITGFWLILNLSCTKISDGLRWCSLLYSKVNEVCRPLIPTTTDYFNLREVVLTEKFRSYS